ncbi:hemolysin III family protein [Alisedimentitalea sp. MJ-SS2]|uniref:PAQR family membrane homeostasis protein TrhA n=1 Tax=Aliisedimentitalea sp. MJ-SS2 TaxID=3049795 RepID=UPI00290838DD|nr:hemolysin III family protein [Alisedimentitalea sp. MJ-SS2]MDU8927775.1 hemolysin III family protein [Alisedimentitalea sp. MJ-SS2]
MQDQHPPYPTFARSERILDAAMHILGIAGALTGTIWLIIWTWGHVSGGQSVALSVYGVTLIAGFFASGIYHFTPWEHWRTTFRRFDHAAIYLKIAGTYTPLVVMIGSLSSYLVLAAIWGLAAFGMISKLFFWRNPNSQGIALYLIMGWLSVLLVGSLFSVLPGGALILIAVGGGLYTLGVVFHVWENLKFSNAIWHGFVLSASVCFFIAIAMGAQASG